MLDCGTKDQGCISKPEARRQERQAYKPARHFLIFSCNPQVSSRKVAGKLSRRLGDCPKSLGTFGLGYGTVLLCTNTSLGACRKGC